MIYPPAVIIHGLAHATVALAPGLPVTLLSARGAAQYAGCAWWQAMVNIARARHPDVPVIDILDCADAPGRAMAALRVGQRILILDPCPAWAEVAGAAETMGATLLPIPPPALDLETTGAASRLKDWLLGFDDNEAGLR
jgi:hypothetical protein